MELETLTVYKSPLPKIRLGKNNDGGYVMVDGCNIDFLLSAGVSDDVSFEIDFLNKYKTINAVAFDGTVNRLPQQHSKLTFVQKNVGNIVSSSIDNLHSYLNSYNNIFLKMDIEGCEYDWINTLSKEQMNNISQVVMEFHLHLDKHWTGDYSIFCNNMIKKWYDTHVLVHLHPNNCQPTRKLQGQDFPLVFEVCFLRKDYFKDFPLTLSTEPIPGELDQINVHCCPLITLKGYPYN